MLAMLLKRRCGDMVGVSMEAVRRLAPTVHMYARGHAPLPMTGREFPSSTFEEE